MTQFTLHSQHVLPIWLPTANSRQYVADYQYSIFLLERVFFPS